MTNVLIFTTIEKLGYLLMIKDDEMEFVDTFKASIEEEYGIGVNTMKHRSIYGSEAMNGDLLYIEVVSEDEEMVNAIASQMVEANLSTRTDLANWITKKAFTLIESEGDLGQHDEYFIAI